jgi:hypothetical protein
LERWCLAFQPQTYQGLKTQFADRNFYGVADITAVISFRYFASECGYTLGRRDGPVNRGDFARKV